MGGAAIPTEEPDSDAFDEETEEADEQAASPPSPVATDATMASSETALAMSISSATPELAEEAAVPSGCQSRAMENPTQETSPDGGVCPAPGKHPGTRPGG